MTYELIIERQQPTCGGKSPFKCEIKSVTTDDPLAYVKKLEPGSEPEFSTTEAGELVYEMHDFKGMLIRYIFTED
jgi:hypothetical protein